MCEHSAEILACLQRIETTMNSDKYEMLGIWTVGGGNSLYTLKSPVNTESEWCLFGVSATGACQILVSNNPAPNNLATSGGVNYGDSGGNESNALEGIYMAISAASVGNPVSDFYWQPTGRGSSIYINIAGLSSASAFVMVAWRRLLARYIPEPRRQLPLTHATRQSTRFLRTLPAESTQVQGFEQQYPVPGGGFFKHNETPTNSDVNELRGTLAENPTQAQIVLAKLRGKGGTY